MRLIEAFVPIWTLTVVGYLARRRGLFDSAATVTLGSYVFHLAMPAALFLTMSTMPLSHFEWRSLAAFGASIALVISVGWLAISKAFHRKPGERPIWAMTAGYVNSANLGIPIAAQVLHSIAFLAQVVLLQTLIVTPLILISLDRHHDAGGQAALRRVATLPLRNPVVLASALGLVWSVARLPVPPPAHDSLKLLSDSAAPCALIALGASLYGVPALAAPVPEVSTVTALKLLVQPLTAYIVGLALHLSGTNLLSVVLIAGLPTAQNAFIFAQQYGVAEGLANRAVMVTTTASLATLAAIVALLGAG